jgi:hypothetical protein
MFPEIFPRQESRSAYHNRFLFIGLRRRSICPTRKLTALMLLPPSADKKGPSYTKAVSSPVPMLFEGPWVRSTEHRKDRINRINRIDASRTLFARTTT